MTTIRPHKDMPYGGMYGDMSDTEVKTGFSYNFAQTGPHLLTCGKTGSGKSFRVLSNQLLLWQGPKIAVSSKPDLIDLVLPDQVAQHGAEHTYVIDLSGDIRQETLPEGVRKVVIDPTELLTSDKECMDMASMLIKCGKLGASSSAESSGDGFWDSLPVVTFAGILSAASKPVFDDSARGMTWARRALMMVSPPEEEATNPDYPCWLSAISRLETRDPDSELAQDILASSKLDEKQVSSMMITMKVAAMPWSTPEVAGFGDELPFSPMLLAHKDAALFMVAPAEGSAAGAAVSVAEVVCQRWRKSQYETKKLPRILFVIDEFVNTMPWPNSRIVVGEARGMGIVLSCAVQATSQLVRRFGEAGTKELRDIFPAVLILVGAPEKELLENAAWWSGSTNRRKETFDATGAVTSTTFETVQKQQSFELLPRDVEHGRLLGGKPAQDRTPSLNPAGLEVELPTYVEMRESLGLPLRADLMR